MYMYIHTCTYRYIMYKYIIVITPHILDSTAASRAGKTAYYYYYYYYYCYYYYYYYNE